MRPDRETFIAEVDENSAGERLDRWLAKLEYISSRSRASWLISEGLVTIDGRKLKASFRVSPGEKIQIEIPRTPAEGPLEPLAAPLEIVYQDEDVVVINKPAGLVVHPAAGHAQDTLVNILLHHIPNLSMGFAERRPGIVHRLDRDTSGLLVVAKNDSAHHALAAQFKSKTAKRVYWAIVAGAFAQPSGTFHSHLARHPTDRKRFASAKSAGGKLAITHYKTLQRTRDYSWIECRLETGRTHQIRVHMSESGHPILGDPIYGGRFKKSAPRLMLHATELGFTHPRTHTELHFQTPWPPDLESFIKKLGFKI